MLLATDPSERDATAVLEETRPFRRHPQDQASFEATVRGTIPDWLRGDLVRTCPAVFARGNKWRAAHWFDGLGMLYAFRIDGKGVAYRQRMLESEYAREAERDIPALASFATPMKRHVLRRMTQPAPGTSDNANVHIVPMSGELVAMTETPRPLAIDPQTLAVRGPVSFEDDGLGGAAMLAHPQLDPQGGHIVNLATQLGPTCVLTLYDQPRDRYRRTPFASWKTRRLPYVHSFGLTARHAVIIDHPLRVGVLSLLFSDRGFIDHFAWEPETGTRLHVLGRDGTTREHETDAFFTFHVVNTFERGDDLVLDVVAYETPALIDALRTERLAKMGLPPFGHLERIVMTKGKPRATRERLAACHFEFPQIHYRAHGGRDYRYAWGAGIEGGVSQLLCIDTHRGETRTMRGEQCVFGEPIFVRRPDGEDERDGVLLAVASGSPDAKEARAAMVVVDARTMEEIARAEIAADIPLGFHGSFVR